jgi:hypothetical protein
MYHKLNKDKVVYLDIDDSIILWSPELYPHAEEDLIWIDDGLTRSFPFLPHKRNIEFVKRLKLQGYGVVAWSAAGANWASTVINKLGLQDLPDMIISKPELCIDDFLDPKRIIKSIIWLDPITGEFRRNA